MFLFFWQNDEYNILFVSNNRTQRVVPFMIRAFKLIPKKRWLELIIHHSLTTLNWPSLQVKGNGVMHFVVFILDAVWLSITLDYVLCPSTRYQFEQMFFHWSDSDQGGSEHQINNHSFPAEVQFYGFNAHLFNNLSEAVMHPHGAVGVAIMIQVSDRGSNRGLKPLTSQLKKVQI